MQSPPGRAAALHESRPFVGVAVAAPNGHRPPLKHVQTGGGGRHPPFARFRRPGASAEALSAAHTERLGTPGMDLLHVAAAHAIDVQNF